MILADIIRKSLDDPMFFYGVKKTKDIAADAVEWRSNLLAAERYILDDSASRAIGGFGMDDPAVFEKALPLIRLPYPIIWVEFNLKSSMLGAGGDPNKDGDTHCGILIKRRPFLGHPNALIFHFVLDGDNDTRKAVRPLGRLPSRVIASPVIFAFDPLSPFHDEDGNLLDENGKHTSREEQNKTIVRFHKESGVKIRTYQDTDEAALKLSVRQNHGVMMGSALHRAASDKNDDHIRRYYQIARHGIMLNDELCVHNIAASLGTDAMFELMNDTFRAMSGDFRRALAILSLLSIRYPEKSKAEPLLRRSSVDSQRDLQGRKLLAHTSVTMNIPRTVKVDYHRYLRNTEKALNLTPRIIPRHDVEACWAHNYRRHNARVCEPYDLHCWVAHDLRVEKNADPVPDPHRFTCAHCGLRRWYRPERESGTPGAPRQTRDRFVTHRTSEAA